MSKNSAPRTVDASADCQKTPGSFVVSNGIVNCSCGSIKNTVQLVIPDRGSDMGGSPMCMNADTKPSNFSSNFGICSKTGEVCLLNSLEPEWSTFAKVPAYSRYERISNSKAGNLKKGQLVDYYPIVLESLLVCWHYGAAGIITIYQNGQNG